MIDAVLEGLAGTWSFKRTIEGHGDMAGSARFTSRPDGLLHYCEEGRLTLAGGAFNFSRSYLYGARALGFEVFFDEAQPRLFQSVALVKENNVLTGHGYHLCAADSYESAYAFELPERFAITHAVSGPRKSYLSETRFARRN